MSKFKKGDKFVNKNGAVCVVTYSDEKGNVTFKVGNYMNNVSEGSLENMLKANGYVKTKDNIDEAIEALSAEEKVEDAYNRYSGYTDKKFLKEAIEEMKRYERNWSFMTAKEKREIAPNGKSMLKDFIKQAEERLKQLDSSSVKDNSRVIAQKKGYILGVNNEGTVVLAFPGEDMNSNPHMYLGKESSANINKAKEMFMKIVGDEAPKLDPITGFLVKDEAPKASLDKAIRTADATGFDSIIKYFENKCKEGIKSVNPQNADKIYNGLTKEYNSCMKDLDDTLESINKEYKDAKSKLNGLNKEYGFKFSAALRK